MKKSLAEHKTELERLLAMMKEEEEMARNIRRNLDEGIYKRFSEIHLLKCQIMEAERLRRDGFDAAQFMKRRK